MAAMKSYFRIRAIVDEQLVEMVCPGDDVESAIRFFKRADPDDTGTPYGSFDIELAMIHKLVFGDEAPIFEDVTESIISSHTRCSYEQAMLFYRAYPNVAAVTKLVSGLTEIAQLGARERPEKNVLRTFQDAESYSDANARYEIAELARKTLRAAGIPA